MIREYGLVPFFFGIIDLKGIRVVGKGSWNRDVGKFLSWKVRHEIGKNEVERFGLMLKSTTEIGKLVFNCGETFQLQKKLSNFVRFFPTSLGSFQIKQNFSNFRLSNLKFANFSFFPTALSNYTYPIWKNWQHTTLSCATVKCVFSLFLVVLNSRNVNFIITFFRFSTL